MNYKTEMKECITLKYMLFVIGIFGVWLILCCVTIFYTFSNRLSALLTSIAHELHEQYKDMTGYNHIDSILKMKAML